MAIPAQGPRPIRVLCVDDNIILTDALRRTIDAAPDLCCVGTLGTADGLLEAVASGCPDIILLDLDMPGADPMEALRGLTRACPQVRGIILSAHIRDAHIDEAAAAGGWGYLSKGDRPEEIMDAVRRVWAGEFVLGTEVLAYCGRVGRRG